MQDGPWILGIAASHNGGACLLRGSEVVVAIQEERLTRCKRHPIHGATPALSIMYCLRAAGVSASDLDGVVVCPQGRIDAPENDPTANRLIASARRTARFAAIPHHLGHAVGARALSGFDDCAIVVIDGMGSRFEDLLADEARSSDGRRGDRESVSVYLASGSHVRPVEKHMVSGGKWLTVTGDGMPHFGTIGGLYAAASSQIFGTPFEAGKVMGLAPFGEPEYDVAEFFTRDGCSFVFSKSIPARFAGPPRRGHPDLNAHRALAASAQRALEEAVLGVVAHVRSKYKPRHLCMAGGVALNVTANERLIEEGGFDRVFVIPAAEDCGTAIGAAYWGLWKWFGFSRSAPVRTDCFGRTYSEQEVVAAARATGDAVDRTAAWVQTAVDLIVDGKLVGWFYRGSEFGPRALGGRCILGDPRRSDLKDRINLAVKGRESFQPLAPTVLLDEVSQWFRDCGGPNESPFMLRTRHFAPQRRDAVPAVCHVDGTGRLQTVTSSDNGSFYDLVYAFFKRTGVPMLVNTSFNGRGEPIVETPTDALNCMREHALSCCVFEGAVVWPRAEQST